MSQARRSGALSHSEDSRVDTSGSTASCGGAASRSRVLRLKDSAEPTARAKAQDDGPVMATDFKREVRPDSQVDTSGSTASCGGAASRGRVLRLKDSAEPTTRAKAQDDGPVMASKEPMCCYVCLWHLSLRVTKTT
jgi:hypothetical protein